MHKHLPNFLTLLNLTSGCVGIVWALQGDLTQAAWCIWLGALLDFLDGLAARLLQAYSPLGQQLDSLADLVTFGLLPASIMYVLISQQTVSAYLPCVALLMPSFSALRLAQFNVDDRQQAVFIGLPTPAHGLFISTLPMIISANQYPWLTAWLAAPYVLVTLALLTSGMLIANVKLMAFKLTTYACYPNRFKYGFLCMAVLLTALLRVEGLALSIVLYVLVSRLCS
ncbi:MAG: CDP-diacylglycerol--serine O-phosphatidyltransferase [Roseivirga sp.]